jgi:3-oxoadipate enol-lactonase
VPGVRLACRTWGDPVARPMVSLHGGSSDGSTWAEVAAQLPIHSYALGRVTLAGHSAGGVVAYLTAMTRPERIAALVLEEPVPPVPHDMRPSQPRRSRAPIW